MPSITIWSRIEPRARTDDMQRALEARVHDPLWLLTRQWQLGEFAGRDAGSPVSVQLQATAVPFDRYAAADGKPRAYDNRLPLETLVEREPVRPSGAAGDLRQAVEAGLQFFRLLDAAGLTRLRQLYLDQYALPSIPRLDAEGQQLLAVASGRVIDGVRLYTDLVHAGNSLPALPAIPGPDHDAVLPIAREFVGWYKTLFSEPAHPDTWSPDRMEYQFAIAAGDTGKLITREYDGGSIDWHTFDRASDTMTGAAPKPVTITRTSMPSPVTFRGMPSRRFWELEDAAVDIGALSAAAEDIGRLLLRDFALIYGNDWFEIPLAVPAGAEVRIKPLTVADTFGVSTAIPHYTEVDGQTGGWRMFAVSPVAGGPDAQAASAHVLVVVPNTVAPLDSEPVEDVLLLRDEVANMGWGVESVAPGKSGYRLDRALAYRSSAAPVSPPAAGGIPNYRLGSSVPDYWIPFIPVPVDSGPLRMRVGKLPTAATGPIGRLLGYPGLTIFLEELPREGVHLHRRYRYARGPDGSTYVWIGRRRFTGRGERGSGLRFDYLDFG